MATPCRAVLVILSAVIATGGAIDASAQEWSRFRGPNGAGQSDATTIPVSFTPQQIVWKASLPGKGHSSPVLWGERLFVSSGDLATGDQILVCLNAMTGQQIWRRRLPSSAYHLHDRNSFASSTPCVDEDHLYFTYANPASCKLMAMDHDGRDVWEVDMGAYESEHGYGMSPTVYRDMVIAAAEQRGRGFIVAVDRMTGKEKWRISRTTKSEPYSTPCVRTLADGDEELIFESGSAGLTAVNPADGSINWSISPFDKRTVSSPILAGDLVIGACGAGEGGNYLVGVRPPASRSGRAELVYKISDVSPYVPTSIVVGDAAFLWYDGGAITCIDAASGNVHWRSRAPGTYAGSPVRVGNRIYCINQEGDLIVIAASSEAYNLLAQIPLGGPSQATPAVALGRMFLRTESSIICVGGE